MQKYVHDMKAWNALPVEEQERVIGRTKSANIELDDDAKPADSHVALNTVTAADGSQLQILRDNMPWGTVGQGEYGTYFIGYSRTPEVTEQMLRNMFVGNPPGTYDRILDFSTAVTGSLFFTPTAGFLGDLPEPPNQAVPPERVVVAATATGAGASLGAADGSLGIGSLKRSTSR